MKKLVLCLLLAAAILPLLPDTAEARCGGRGIFRGRVRGFISNHRPHLFGGCR